MEIAPLDYQALNEHYSFGKPNRLFVLVHPGWDCRVGKNILPLWKEYVDIIARDDNSALLIVQGYGPDTIPDHKPNDSWWIQFALRQKKYNREVKNWVGELADRFDSRLVLYDRAGAFPKDEKHRIWLKAKLGNPPPITHGDSVLADFFTIDYSGMYRDSCVDWQKQSFPCSSARLPGYWFIYY